MRVITRIGCDNMGCPNQADPETYIDSKGREIHRPPYGWLHLKGYFMGVGPNVEVTVCSTACLEPAVDRIVEQERMPG